MYMGDPSRLEEHILEHYTEIKPKVTAEGLDARMIADDDQTVQHLRNLGWSDIAIGAYLTVEALPSSPDYCPAGLMLGALYFQSGRVR